MTRKACLGAALLALSCGQPAEVEDENTGGGETTVEVVRAEPRQEPPPSGPRRDLTFPTITRASGPGGLELNTVRAGGLPVVYLRAVIRSGDAADPADQPGLAHLVAQMLEEGTTTRSSAQLAEDVEFLGANLSVGTDEENLYVQIRALSDQLPEAFELLADVLRNPRFNVLELDRLKRRERDRLSLSSGNPRWLARRVLYRELYGADHPYAHVDVGEETLDDVRRTDLVNWHRRHVRPNNAYLIAVGDVDAERIAQQAQRAFRGWATRDVPEVDYPEPPSRTEREIIVVNRPGSSQSVIYVTNLALPRASDAFVPLLVANQVLGGSAASRLFMDLRERRSLTYGAYSSVGERVQVAPFVAQAAVPNPATEPALAAFMEQLDRIVTEAPPLEELVDAQTYLSDKFPLEIETPARIVSMVDELRTFGLPDDYWDTYRTAIREVDAQEAFTAARTYIRPEQALVIAVGEGSEIVEPLRRYGPVRVEDAEGNLVETFEALAD